MIRLHVICEGTTEEMFVNELLAPALVARGVAVLPARIGVPGHKGGNVNLPRLLGDLEKRLRRDRQCYCTCLLDYYGLPSDFPGKAAAVTAMDSAAKLTCIREALRAAVAPRLGEAARRFLPYVQMHEFEGLLFSDPQAVAESLRQPELAEHLVAIRAAAGNPEEINDSPQTAPSKRLISLYPGFDKPLHPLLAIRDIGLATVRRECSLFNGWLVELEALGTGAICAPPKP